MESSPLKHIGVLPIRVVQVLSICSMIVGFIWSTSDWLLLTVLVGVPVTPLSVLLMLYGSMGTLLSEAAVRLLKKKLNG